MHATLTIMFNKFRDDPVNAPDEINIPGITALLNEMEIGLDDVGSFVFCELVQSPSLGKVMRNAFIVGCMGVEANSVPKLRNVIYQRREQLATDPFLFKRIYNHVFTLGRVAPQKVVQLDIATEFWRVLFTSPSMEWRSPESPWLDWWLEFVNNKVSNSISKDLWQQTLAFAEATLEDDTLGFWDEMGSWPTVIDDFAKWVKVTKRGERGPNDDEGNARDNGDAMDVE